MAKKFPAARLRMDGPATYRIFVQGGLEEKWSGRLGGLKIAVSAGEEESVVTQLSGELMDQAALLGVLNTLYDLHLPLLGVVETERFYDSAISEQSGE